MLRGIEKKYSGEMTECRAGMTDWRGDGRSEYEGNHVRMVQETCSRGGSRRLRARSARTGPQMSQQDNTRKTQTAFLTSPPSSSPGFPAGRLPFLTVTTSHLRDSCLLSGRKSVILAEVHGRLRVLKGAPELPSARAIAPPSRACGRLLPWDSVLAARRIV
jgi:hypothetical protein